MPGQVESSIQHLSDLARHSRKAGGSSNCSVSGDLAPWNLANGGFDPHPDFRRFIGSGWVRRSGGAWVCSAFPRHIASLFVAIAFFLHSEIQPMRISQSDQMETISHKIIPCNNGRGPTRLLVATEMPVPIRNKVAVNPIFASLT